MGFAKNLKTYRTNQSLSLRNLAALSQVSKTMLSEIENERKTPTITVACRIANALGVSLSTLMSGNDEVKSVSIIHKNERHSYVDPDTLIVKQSILPTLPTNDIEIMIVTMPAGTSTGLMPPYKPGSKEYLVLTKGSIQVQIGTDTICDLTEGDSIHFEADIEHVIKNTEIDDAEYFLVFHHSPL